MEEEIEKYPKIPEEIKEAAKAGKLIIFMGAGVSRLYGCDSWKELAERLIHKCHCLGLTKYKEKEHLLYLLEERREKKVITICKGLLDSDEGRKGEYHGTLKEGLTHKKELSEDVGGNIYTYLSKIGGCTYLTTNIDSTFPKDFINNRIYKLNDFRPGIIGQYDLYHLHGYIDDIRSLVLSIPEYLKRYSGYAEENQPFIGFLKEVFEDKVVLFLGYGVNELEILEFITLRTPDKINSSKTKFILLPFNQGEENILRNEKFYFEELDIEVIAYQKCGKGYKQLVNVIRNWAEQMPQITTISTFRELEGIIEDGEM